MVIGFTEIVFAVSLASLIFTGEMNRYLPLGIRIAMASLAITTITVSLISTIPFIISRLHFTPAVLQGVIMTGVFSALSISRPSDTLPTSLAVLTLISFLSGLIFLILGIFNLGGLVRFIPFPVIGGILAGTGWLLVKASFKVMTGFPLQLNRLFALLHVDPLIKWLPGLALSLVLIIRLRWVKHVLTLPGMLILSFFLFNILLLVTGTSLKEAYELGLMLGDATQRIKWEQICFPDLPNANWQVILGQTGNIASVIILCFLGLLMHTTGLELVIKRDIDIDRELKSAGIANLLSSVGGMVGYQSLSESALSNRMGAKSRLGGLIAGIMPIVVLITGISLLTLFPKSWLEVCCSIWVLSF